MIRSPLHAMARVDLRTPNKTHDWRDLEEPAVVQARRSLTRFLLCGFTFRATPVAINGVLRFRWRIRPLKLWEYARGWVAAPVTAGQKLLDVGGGGTLPPCFAATQGAEVFVLDPDTQLNQATDRLAHARGWAITTSAADLAAEQEAWPVGWPVGAFDAIHSYCVVEHIPYAGQERLLKRLAHALGPGGRMVLTFEYGEQAPGEAPWRDRERLDRMVELMMEAGLQLVEPTDFEDAGHREVLDRRYPEAPFAFGMLVLEKPLRVS
ncbi:MAG: class I SAM-dependent methyltransferase [Planctomycetes bacterium]|nr:class I SAM-dependent methyltransferase [Planctomycetota bacterium]